VGPASAVRAVIAPGPHVDVQPTAECAPASQGARERADMGRILLPHARWSVNDASIFEPYETASRNSDGWELSSLCYLYTVSRRPARRGDDTIVATELTHAAGDVETGAGRTQAVPKLRHPTGVGSVAARVEVAAEARVVAPAPPQVRSVAAAEL